jgi:hypothetical protein
MHCFIPFVLIYLLLKNINRVKHSAQYTISPLYKKKELLTEGRGQVGTDTRNWAQILAFPPQMELGNRIPGLL